MVVGDKWWRQATSRGVLGVTVASQAPAAKVNNQKAINSESLTVFIYHVVYYVTSYYPSKIDGF